MSEPSSQSFADRIVVGDHQLDSAPRNLRDVSDGTVLVGQLHKDITTECLLVTDVELLSAEWAFQFSIENDGKGTRIKKMTTEIGMAVTSGKEVSDSISASAGFSGWGFSAEINASTETKTFTSVETSTRTVVEDEYTCPPESSIFVYKRQYKFRCRSWIYRADKEAWFEYPDGRKYEAHFINDIVANQELISPVALANHGRIVNNPPSGLVRPTKGYRMQSAFSDIALVMILRSMFPWIV